MPSVFPETKPQPCYIDFPGYGRAIGECVPFHHDPEFFIVRVERYQLPATLREHFERANAGRLWFHTESMMPRENVWIILGAAENA